MVVPSTGIGFLSGHCDNSVRCHNRILFIYTMNVLDKPIFIGLDNYIRALKEDPVFRIAFVNILKYVVAFTTLPMWLGFFIALLVGRVTKMQTFYRVVFFLPVVIASVVTGRLWQGIYHPFFGINRVFQNIGLSFTLPTLASPNTALYSVLTADMWHWWGFNMVIFLSALQQIEPAYYEASELEGANTFQKLIYVTIPFLKPTIIFLLLMTAVMSLVSFDYVYIMTQGGPGHASELLSTYLYKLAFHNFEAGYGSALGVLLTLFSLFFICGYVFVRRKGWEL